MIHQRNALRAIILAELLMVVSGGVIIMGIVIVALNETIHIHRAAAAHADRQATIEMLTHQLRNDLRAATAWQWQDGTLTLTAEIGTQPAVVAYQFRPEAVARSAGGNETHVWRSRGLEFAAQIETGPRAGVLSIAISHQPRGGGKRVIDPSLTFLIPPAGGGRL